MSSDPDFLLRSALRFPIPGPEHAELGPGDVRPSLQFELSDKRYQISDIRSVTYNGSVGSPHEFSRIHVKPRVKYFLSRIDPIEGYISRVKCENLAIAPKNIGTLSLPSAYSSVYRKCLGTAWL